MRIVDIDPAIQALENTANKLRAKNNGLGFCIYQNVADCLKMLPVIETKEYKK